MYNYTGRFVYLAELTTENDPVLFELMLQHAADYQSTVFNQAVPSSYCEFRSLLGNWFSHGRVCQFLVYQKSSDRLIGTIFFYGLQAGQSVKLSVFFTQPYRKGCWIAETMGIAVSFAYHVLSVKCVMFAVYPENVPMLSLCGKLKLVRLSGLGINTKCSLKFSLEEEAIIDIISRLHKLEAKADIK